MWTIVELPATRFDYNNSITGISRSANRFIHTPGSAPNLFSTACPQAVRRVVHRPPTGVGRDCRNTGLTLAERVEVGRLAVTAQAPAAVYDDRDLDRTPPQDLAAEQSVLGAMMMSKDAISDVVEVLRGADFYRPNHESIYDAIISLYGRGEPADPITVAGELGKSGLLSKVGGAVYLHDLLSSVSIAANAPYYAEIVRDKAVLRRLVNASIRIAQLGYGGAGEVDKIVDEAQQTLFEVTDRNAAEDYKSLRELLEPTFDEMEAIANSGDALSGVPTGFTELDRLTNGLHPGQMIIVAARPGVGKSTFALDVCRSAAIHHNLPAAFFSLEMSRTEIVMKILLSLIHI